VLSAVRPNLTEASFELSGDATTVRISTDDLAGDLYRIASPAGGATRATATVTGTVLRVVLSDSGHQGQSLVEVRLADSVRWSVRVASGLRRGEIDLTKGRPGPVVLTGDAADLSLVLPSPAGTLRVRISGGINRLHISVPREAPVRIRTRGGAGRAYLDGRTVHGVARNTSFQTAQWRPDSTGIDIDATAGLGAVKLDHEGQ
jgi:hypothetical protein